MAEKQYYWLKLEKDFFKSKEIKKLRKIAGGDTLTIIYLKMALYSLENEGILVYEGIEDDLASELSLELDEEVENIKLVLAFLQNNKMIETKGEDFYLNRIPEMTGKETGAAKRMRISRQRKEENKQLECNKVTELLQDVTTSYTEKEKDIELEKDKDLDKELEKEKDMNKEKEIKLYSLWNEDQLKKIFIKYPDIDLFVYENKILDYELKENKKYSNYLSALNTFVANDKKYNKDYIKEFKETVKPRIVYELDEEGHEIKF